MVIRCRTAWVGDAVTRLLRLTFLFAWGLGTLALILFWLALVGIGWSMLLIAVVWAVALVAGWRVSLRLTMRDDEAPLNPVERLLIGAIILVAAAILFNAAYFPFSRDDALGIYRPAALAMWNSGGLEPLIGAESLYRTYPILVPLLYTFSYQVSGWENEYLAKTLGTLLSLGCLPAVWLLGVEVGGRRAGLIAALLLTLTPAFARWASAGYVDLPMACYYTLSVLFAVRFARRRRAIDALLAGMMMGFAAFTKNAALIGVPLLAVWLAIAAWRGGWGVRRAALGGLLACAVIGAPWYIRNLIGAGFIIPATAWTDQAERSLRTLAIYITLPDNFALTGWLVLAGMGWAGWRVIRSRLTDPAALALLWFTVPFFAAWWLFVSYDPRFLMLFTPILCAAAGALLAGLVDRLAVPRVRAGLVAAACVWALAMAWIAVEHKGAILRDPFMSGADKVALVRGAP